MSLLLKICETVNTKYLDQSFRFKGIIENPRIFTLTINDESAGFYHICSPRRLLAKLLASELSTNEQLNALLNDHVAKFVTSKSGELFCGNCRIQVPRQLVGKLDIIQNARKLTLR